MKEAIFDREFGYSSRTTNAGWSAKPSPNPQTFPAEFIDAAVKAGVATEVKPTPKGNKAKETDNG